MSQDATKEGIMRNLLLHIVSFIFCLILVGLFFLSIIGYCLLSDFLTNIFINLFDSCGFFCLIYKFFYILLLFVLSITLILTLLCLFYFGGIGIEKLDWYFFKMFFIRRCKLKRICKLTNKPNM